MYMKKKSYFSKWRVSRSNLFINTKNKERSIKTTQKVNTSSEIIPPNSNYTQRNKQESDEENILLYHYDKSFPGLSIKQRENNYKNSKNELNVFNRLYLEGINKGDKQLYNENIKHIKEKS